MISVDNCNSRQDSTKIPHFFQDILLQTWYLMLYSHAEDLVEERERCDQPSPLAYTLRQGQAGSDLRPRLPPKMSNRETKWRTNTNDRSRTFLSVSTSRMASVCNPIYPTRDLFDEKHIFTVHLRSESFWWFSYPACDCRRKTQDGWGRGLRKSRRSA